MLFRTLAVASTCLFVACQQPQKIEPASVVVESDVSSALELLNDEFRRNVYTVTDGVYQAVGFGIANSIMVEGDECVFIVDVMGSMETAKEVKAEFDKITQKPIEALIYTHNHADHVMGGLAFAPDGKVDVYAHDTTNYYINRFANVLRPVLRKRSARMFGSYLRDLGPDQMENVGLGPFVETLDPNMTLGLIRPNKTFSDELETEICGVKVHLVHAPGETNDQLFVWLPERGVLLPGDNIYKAFPNLYSIRGTLYRDVLAWAYSIDKMRALRPTHLVPSHTRSISGQDEVYETLTAYRDAIQFVHDQTIRGINQGLTPDELVEVVKLPPHLAEHPFLQEYYGKVEWSVRGIFNGYLGWFDGDAARLEPANPDERAAGMASLAGGAESLQRAAREALEKEQYEWAAELATHLIQLDPSSANAKQIKADALRALGQRQINANARNYYITQALELEGTIEIRDDTRPENALSFVSTVPIGRFVAAMPANLIYERSADKDMLVGFRFPDVDEGYGIHIRRGVAEFQESFTGSALDLVGFLRLFKPAVE
ncbi:MAG: MBL fold metallo-hydrolase [Deltaproteobacteria bacterium]|nr:MBL fold metallo-hydrolase [Deltaproteobacteria bacterium]